MGNLGLKAIEPERIIGKQIEAARVALTRIYEKNRKSVGLEFSKHTSFKKPTEVRMGKGKGSPE
jgi:large subunit ribosomal protein L16